MDIYGDRYAPVSDFIGYCSDLNVETSERELEHYEKTGVMLPVARVIYPDEYIVRLYDRPCEGVVNWGEIKRWPALLRLEENFGPFPHWCKDLADEKLVHSFDRELDAGCNPYLSVPDSSADFRHWHEYRTTVTDKHGRKFKRSNVEHYYAYWQVHQLALVQRYPDLYENAHLIDQIPQNSKWKKFYPRAPKAEFFAKFQGWARHFDALSFWIAVYTRERSRTFSSIPETNGISQLDRDQGDAYRDRLVKHAQVVKERFDLDIEDVHNFLRWLVDTFQDYERGERYKLSLELKNDIFRMEDFYRLITGKTRDETADAVWENDRHGRRAFRHLMLESKERDYAFDVLNRIASQKSWNRADSNWAFSGSDVNALLDYCEQEGLDLLITALSGMVAMGDEERRQNFRWVRMYTNLKNILTSCEYLLKGLAEKDLLDAVAGKTLTPVVISIVSEEDWFGIFRERMEKGLLNVNSEDEFLDKLHTLLGDQTLNEPANVFWAQAFLITCLARNGTVHVYPTDDMYYGDLFGPVLDAVAHAMFYTWKLAQANRATQETGDKR